MIVLAWSVYRKVGDCSLALPCVTMRVGRGARWWRRGSGGQLEGGDAAGVPVGPEDAVGLDMQVHSVDAHVGVTLEGLLVHPVGHARVQTADLVIISDVQHLPVDIQTWYRQYRVCNKIRDTIHLMGFESFTYRHNAVYGLNKVVGMEAIEPLNLSQLICLVIICENVFKL